MTNDNKMSLQTVDAYLKGGTVDSQDVVAAKATVNKGRKYVVIAGQTGSMEALTKDIAKLIKQEKGGANADTIQSIRASIAKLEKSAKSKQTGLIGSLAKICNWIRGNSNANVKRIDKAIKKQEKAFKKSSALETVIEVDEEALKIKENLAEFEALPKQDASKKANALLDPSLPNTEDTEEASGQVLSSAQRKALGLPELTKGTHKSINTIAKQKKFEMTAVRDFISAIRGLKVAKEEASVHQGKLKDIVAASKFVKANINAEMDSKVEDVQEDIDERNSGVTGAVKSRDPAFLQTLLGAGSADKVDDLSTLELERQRRHKQTFFRFKAAATQHAATSEKAEFKVEKSRAKVADTRRTYQAVSQFARKNKAKEQAAAEIQEVLNRLNAKLAPITKDQKGVHAEIAEARFASAGTTLTAVAKLQQKASRMPGVIKLREDNAKATAFRKAKLKKKGVAGLQANAEASRTAKVPSQAPESPKRGPIHSRVGISAVGIAARAVTFNQWKVQ